MQLLVKLQAVGLMQLYKKYAPSQLFFKNLIGDFTTNSLGRAISEKPTSLERLQWLFLPVCIISTFPITFTCPKLER